MDIKCASFSKNTVSELAHTMHTQTQVKCVCIPQSKFQQTAFGFCVKYIIAILGEFHQWNTWWSGPGSATRRSVSTTGRHSNSKYTSLFNVGHFHVACLLQVSPGKHLTLEYRLFTSWVVTEVKMVSFTRWCFFLQMPSSFGSTRAT